MAEPQPAGIQERAHVPAVAPGSSEDRKAATALSNLDSKVDSNEETAKQADTEALGKAMKGLSVNGGSEAGIRKDGSAGGSESAKTVVVKVDPADVNLLAQQLDLSKGKATELLKSHDADIVRAIAAWIAAT